MKYPTVAINGISVRVDNEGRYNLNDLHAAAVANGEATESQKPSKFIRSAQVRRFIEVLTKGQKSPLEQNQPVRINNGGVNPGIWGVELLVIRYAAWLKPEFEIRVYNTFRDAVRNEFDVMARLNRLDLTIEAETRDISACARKMSHWGAGGRKQLLLAARERMIEQVQPFLPGVQSMPPQN
ncbi:KilA-N domain-containing protein [Xenorhabdus sp. KK7.4]|uniref:KilA-N domain-containing protein n=1 Tax=Xenorhabdus sp. KK7.4 TaxID=1851572 RepID=UPI000C05206E|nr:KilA-N domain-containing protein [Xenorhabdus sp. KK7.4]PHM52493.1 DNA-binding protein [Xenorhabdus sp. KK7.4]